MTIQIVHREIRRFLNNSKPEVLCIRGKWGVGKTYAWDTQLRGAQTASQISVPRYSYVSLFGLNSLEDLRHAIFENVITLATGKFKADLETLDAFVNSNIGSWRGLSKYLQNTPIVGSVFGKDTATLLSFLTIRNQIICFDDLERAGSNLKVGDVLGLASFLREQRNCKIALILNEEELPEDGQRKFATYLEKVVDISLVYEPTAAEASAIALNSADRVGKRIAELSIDLGISNIRVIKKIERFFNAIEPLLVEHDPEVFQVTSASLTLFCWSHFQPNEAPSMEFLKKRTVGQYGLKQDADFSAEEIGWNTLLKAYGYAWTDEFDLVLIDGVMNGVYIPV